MTRLTDFILVLGVMLIAIGLAAVYRPLAPIFVGSVLVYAAVRYGRGEAAIADSNTAGQTGKG